MGQSEWRQRLLVEVVVVLMVVAEAQQQQPEEQTFPLDSYVDIKSELGSGYEWRGYSFIADENIRMTAFYHDVPLQNVYIALFEVNIVSGEEVEVTRLLAWEIATPQDDQTNLTTPVDLKEGKRYLVARAFLDDPGNSLEKYKAYKVDVGQIEANFPVRGWISNNGRDLRVTNTNKYFAVPHDLVGTHFAKEQGGTDLPNLGWKYISIIDNSPYPTVPAPLPSALTPTRTPSSDATGSSTPSTSVSRTPSSTRTTSSSATSSASTTVSLSPSECHTPSRSSSSTPLPSLTPSMTASSSSSDSTTPLNSVSTTPSTSPSFSPRSTAASTVPVVPPQRTDEVDVWPKILNISVVRQSNSVLNISRKLTVSAPEGVTWSFAASTSLKSIVTLPANPVESGYRESVIHFDVASADAGMNTGELLVRFFNAKKAFKEVPVSVRLHISQGIMAIGTDEVAIEKSTTMNEESRLVQLYHGGDHPVFWKSTVLTENADMPPDMFWLQAYGSGFLGDRNSSFLELLILPRNTEKTGIFRAIIRIRTNAWDVRGISDVSRTQRVADGLVADIRVSLTITSVFLCDEFSNPVTLRPHEQKRISVSVVNTELSPIEVRPSNFSFKISNISLGDKALTHAAETVTTLSLTTLSLEAKQTTNGSTLTPWVSFSPSRVSIRRGSSVDLTLVVAYPSRILPLYPDHVVDSQIRTSIRPGNISIDFSIGIKLLDGSFSVGTMDDIVGRSVSLKFATGKANRLHSYLEIPVQEASVEDETLAKIHLGDDFGYEGAFAQYHSTVHANMMNDLPVLTVHLETVDARNSRDPVVYTSDTRLTEGAVLDTLSLRLRFIAVGQASLDVRLNVQPISNSPMNLTSLAVRCDNTSQVRDKSGTSCLCMPGYRRVDQERCVACDEGTVKPSASNDGTCDRCPNGFFSLGGATRCHPCPSVGVQCILGRLRMLPNYWCEDCRLEGGSLQSNRKQLARKFIEGDKVNFGKCIVPQACSVNSSAFVTKCEEGYDGELCGHCRGNYVKLLDGTCAMCRGDDKSIAVIVSSALAVFLLLVGLTAYSTKKSAWEKESKEKTKKTLNKKAGNGRRILNIKTLDVADPRERAQLIHDYYSRNGHWESLKRLILLVVDYLQLASILHQMEITPFSGPLEWLNGVAQASTMNPSNASRLRCSTNASVFGIAVSVMLSPFLLISLLLLLHAVVECKRSKGKFRLKRWATDSVFSLIIVLNLIHMAVTDVTLRSLDTYPEEVQSTTRARIDIAIDTTSSTFATLRAVSLVSLFTFVFGVPVLVGGFLLWWHSKTSTPKLYKELLKFVGGFRLSGCGYLWEQFVLLRKLVLLIVAVFADGPVNQMVLGTGVLLFSYICLAFFRPYYEPSLNHLEALMIMVSALNFYFGLLLFPFGDGKEAPIALSFQNLEYMTVALQTVLLLAVVAVIVALIPGAVSKLTLAVSRKTAPLQRKYKQLLEATRKLCTCKRSDTTNNKEIKKRRRNPMLVNADNTDEIQPLSNPLHRTGASFRKSTWQSIAPRPSLRPSSHKPSMTPIRATPSDSGGEHSKLSGKASPTSPTPRSPNTTSSTSRASRRGRSRAHMSMMLRSTQRCETVSPTGLVVRYNRPAKRLDKRASRMSKARNDRSTRRLGSPNNTTRQAPTSGTNINPLHFSSSRRFSKLPK